MPKTNQSLAISRDIFEIKSYEDINEFIKRLEDGEKIKHLSIYLDDFLLEDESGKKLKENLLKYQAIETLNIESDQEFSKEIVKVITNLLNNNNLKTLEINLAYYQNNSHNLIFETICNNHSLKSLHLFPIFEFDDEFFNLPLERLFRHQSIQYLSLGLKDFPKKTRKNINSSIIINTQLIRFYLYEKPHRVYEIIDGLFYNKSIISVQFSLELPSHKRETFYDVENKLIDILKVNKNLLDICLWGEVDIYQPVKISDNPKLKQLLKNNQDNSYKLSNLILDKQQYLTQGSYIKLENSRSAVGFLLSRDLNESMSLIKQTYNPHRSNFYDRINLDFYYITEQAKAKINEKLKEAEDNTLRTLGVCKELNDDSPLYHILVIGIKEKIFSYNVIRENITPFVVNKKKVEENFKEATKSGNLDDIQSVLNNMTHHSFKDCFENKVTKIIENHKAKYFNSPNQAHSEELTSNESNKFVSRVESTKHGIKRCYNAL